MLWANSKNWADHVCVASQVHRSSDEVPQVIVNLTRVKSLYCGLGQFSYHLAWALARASHTTIAPELLVPCCKRELMADVPLPTNCRLSLDEGTVSSAAIARG